MNANKTSDQDDSGEDHNKELDPELEHLYNKYIQLEQNLFEIQQEVIHRFKKLGLDSVDNTLIK